MALKWARDKARSVGRSIGDSFDRIIDKGGDFFQSLREGDIFGAVGDLFSIGWEAANVLSGGALNIARDELKRALKPDIPRPDYEDRKTMSRNSDTPYRMIYGRARVGGAVRYIESSGTDSSELHIICVFAAHSCEAIERIYLNNELAFIGTTAQGKFAGKAVAILEHGKQSGANAQIVAQTPSGWTNNHKLLGMTYAYLRLTYDRDVFQGAPSVSALVKGKDNIRDPRTGSNRWTDNQALCVMDWLRSEYGYNLSLSEIDEASFADGATICDQAVTSGSGTTEKRYTANGAFSVIGQPQEALNFLNAAGLSLCQYVQGKVRYIAGNYTAPSAGASFDEGEIWSSVQLIPTTGASDRINIVRGTYLDPAQDYEPVDFVPVSIQQYINADKQELPEDAKFPMTTSGTMARRIAKITLERSRFGVRASCTLSWKAFEYSVGDRISLTVAGLGWSGKVFRIEKMQYSLSGVEVELAEDSPLVWAWQEGDAQVITAPPALNLPNPLFVSVPTGLSVSESLYVANDLKTVRSRITIIWNGSATAQRFEIQGSFEGGAYVSLSDYLTAPIYEFDDAEVGSWLFRVRAANSLGAVSAWASIGFNSIGKTAPPADVDQFRGSIRPFGIELLWAPVADLDLDYYEIRLGNDWETATFLQRIQATRWQWETRPNGTENLLIKAVDTSGNESLTASVAELIIRNPNAVTISPQVIDNNVLLRWTDATTSFSIDKYEVRRGAVYASAQTVGTVRSTFANVFETEAGTYTYWIKAIDVAGNVGEPTSVTAAVDQPPDFTLLANQFLSLDGGTAVNMITEQIVTEFTADSVEITADSIQFTADAQGSLALIAPADTSETWAEHFEALPAWMPFNAADNTDWTADSTEVTADGAAQSIQELQIDAGYPVYIQPTPTSGTYEVVVDLLAVIGLSRVRLSPDVNVLSGSPSVRWYMALSEDGVTYDELETLDRVGTSFRYVRIRVEVESDTGVDIVRINSALLRLDVKLRTDQGSGVAESTDAGGTEVFFNVPFVDVQSITTTANGTVPAIVIYDFLDEPNPVSFKVLAFDMAGNRITQPFSWTVRGV